MPLARPDKDKISRQGDDKRDAIDEVMNVRAVDVQIEIGRLARHDEKDRHPRDDKGERVEKQDSEAQLFSERRSGDVMAKD